MNFRFGTLLGITVASVGLFGVTQTQASSYYNTTRLVRVTKTTKISRVSVKQKYKRVKTFTLHKGDYVYTKHTSRYAWGITTAKTYHWNAKYQYCTYKVASSNHSWFSVPKTISFDSTKHYVESSKSYSPSWTDSSWGNSTINIDGINVYTVRKYKSYDGHNINGIVRIHYIIKAGRDISAFPGLGTLTTNTGIQVEAEDYTEGIDGDINSGVTKSGYVYYEIPDLKSARAITTFRLQWDMSYETNDDSDENWYKTFDISL